jgi:DNA primase
MKDIGRKEVRCWCPFCGNDKGRPTASINVQAGLFHCFRCGEGLNALTLFAKVVGIDNKSAYMELTAIGIAA